MIEPATFRKKPVAIEAIQWTGGNASAVKRFCPKAVYHRRTRELSIGTLEGRMTVRPGSWIIKGVEGEFYPRDEKIFDKTYDLVREAA